MPTPRQFARHLLYSPVVVVCILLALAGCLAIYNATFHQAHPTYYVYRQFVWLCLGSAAMILCSLVKPDVYRRYTWPIVGGGLGLLYLLLLLGETRNGMRGWFELKIPALAPIFSPILLQPSELGKPVFVLMLTRLIPEPDDPDRDSWQAFGRYLGWAAAWLLAIALQPDYGTLAVFGCTIMLVWWMRGGPARHLAACAAAGVVGLLIVVLTHPYVKQRLVGYLDPGGHADQAGWHLIQFQLTLASGGLAGNAQPLWSQNYLPLGYSDSIFATVGERIGFLGLLPLIVLPLLWLGYGLRVARRQPDQRAAITVVGLTCLLTLQAFLHISVTLGLLPTTGVTFPLISYGGSSLIASMICVGMVLAHLRKDWSPDLQTPVEDLSLPSA